MYKFTPLAATTLSLFTLGSSTLALADTTVDLPTSTIESSAEGTAAATGEGYRATPKNTTTRLGLTARETPQGVTSVSRQQLNDFKLNSVKDVLDSTPGVTTESVETDRTYFTARGFDITNFQYDGVGMPFANGLLEGDVDMALYEQVDILHGANGLMSGAGNPSAAVNFIRKRPTDTPHAEVSLGAGSWDKRRVDIDVSGPLTATGNVRGRFIYANETGNSWLDRYSKEKNIFSGALAFDLTDRDTLTLGYEETKNNPNANSWGSIPLVDGNGNAIHYSGRSANGAQSSNYWDVDVQRVYGEWVHKFANDWTSKVTLTAEDNRQNANLFYLYYSGSTLYGEPSKYTSDVKRVVADAQVNGHFTLGGRDHELTFGINAGRSRGNERSYFAAGTVFPVSLDDALAGNVQIPALTDSSDANTADYTDRQKSVYAGARFNLTDQLHLITGARMLSADSDGTSYDAAREVRIHGKVTPYAGVVYDLNEQYSLYASYTQVFKPQYYLDAQRRVLDPLEGSSYEAGIKGSLLDKQLEVSAAVFHAKQQNVGEYAGFANGQYIYNGVDYTSRGVELEAKGELAPGLELAGGYTYTYITDADHDRARLYVPRHELKTALTYRLPALPQVKVGGKVRWRSKTENDTYAAANQGAYAVLDLTTQYDIDEHWSTQLNLNNVTDTKYISSLYTYNSNYGAPRNVMASVTWKY